MIQLWPRLTAITESCDNLKTFLHFVEKQHAGVGKAELAGAGMQASPQQSGGGAAVVGSAEGALLLQIGWL